MSLARKPVSMVTVSSSKDVCFNWSFLKAPLVAGMAASFSRSVAPTGVAGRTTAC
ncbi:hypothetical protein D3C81_1901820 [compost metagenome]